MTVILKEVDARGGWRGGKWTCGQVCVWGGGGGGERRILYSSLKVRSLVAMFSSQAKV